MFRFGHKETTWRPFVEQSSATTYAVFVPKEYRLVKEHNKDYDRKFFSFTRVTTHERR